MRAIFLRDIPDLAFSVAAGCDDDVFFLGVDVNTAYKVRVTCTGDNQLAHGRQTPHPPNVIVADGNKRALWMKLDARYAAFV